MGLFDSVVVTDIVNAVRVTSHQGRRETITDRACYGLSFCIEGQITYNHKGKKYVSKKGTAIVLPKGETYELYGDKKGIFPVINFDTLEKFCDTPILIPIGDETPFVNDFAILRSCVGFKKDRIKAMSILYGIMHRLYHDKADAGILSPAVEYLEKNFSDNSISNSLLANRCNVSEVYFRRLFFDKFKTTPKQYIIELRINKAKELLSDGALKVSAVADVCGFTNPYHFSRVFKARVGISPGEYLRENKVYKI